MISIAEAQHLISLHKLDLNTEIIRTSNSLGRVLAQTIHSPADHPFFDQTAVDGYAIKYTSDPVGMQFKVVGEIQAGGTPITVQEGEAVRIFTGAIVPDSCDTIIMQEYVEREGDHILIQPHTVKPGQNVRLKGDQIRKGQLALDKGSVINATAVGFLVSLGIFEIEVYHNPKVSILVTGGEFTDEAKQEEGKIFQSNGVMLQAALQRIGINAEVRECIDDPELLSREIEELSSTSDILIMTGGVSVGSYDFTPMAIENNNFELVFHKVNQKPGKPMLFAAKSNKVVFGLPGNPRAVMIAFYMYILRFIRHSQEVSDPGLLKTTLPLSKSHTFKGDRDVLLAGKIIDGKVSINHGQQSHMLQSLADSDVIVHIPKGISNSEGESVDVYFID